MSKAEDIIKDFLSVVTKSVIKGGNPLDEAVRRIAPRFSSWQNVVDALVQDSAAYNGNAVQFLKDKCGFSFDGAGNITGVGLSSIGSLYLNSDIINGISSAVTKANDIVNGMFPKYLEEGLSGLVNGMDANQRAEVVKIAGNASALASALQPGAIGISSYSAGFIVLNYFLRQVSDAVINSAAVSIPYGAALDGNTLVLGSGFNTPVWLDGLNPLTGQATYKNDSVFFINGAQGGSNTMLAGNWQDNWILGGSESDSLWGGSGGNDTLQGGAGADTFYFGYGCGADVVPDFSLGVGNSSDAIGIYGTGLSSITRGGRTMTLAMVDGASLAVDVGSDTNGIIRYTSDFGVSTQLARIGNTNEGNRLLYDGAVNYFKGGASADAVVVTGGGSHSVWLDGRTGQGFDSIEIIDGAASVGEDQLAGNSEANLIIGGSGNQSLWGGVGGNDTLQGGNGRDMFWYGKFNGDDVITNSGSNDVVNLYDIALGDIAYANVYATGISLGLRSGGSLFVAGNSSTEPAFVLGGENNASYRYNYSRNSWQRE